MTRTIRTNKSTALRRELRGGVDLQSKDLKAKLKGSKTKLSHLRRFDDVGQGGNNNGILEGNELKKAIADGKKRGVDWKKFAGALRSAKGVELVPGSGAGNSQEITAQKKKIARLKKDVEHMQQQEGYYCAPRKDPYSCGAAEKMSEDARADLWKAKKELKFWKRPLQKHSVYYRNGKREDRYFTSNKEGNRFLRSRLFGKNGKLIRQYVPRRLRDDGGSISTVFKNGTKTRVMRNRNGEALTRRARDANGRVRTYRFYPGSPAQPGIPMHITKMMTKKK